MSNNISSKVLDNLKPLLEKGKIDKVAIDKILKTAIYLALIWEEPSKEFRPLNMPGYESRHRRFKKIWDNVQNEEVSDYDNK